MAGASVALVPPRSSVLPPGAGNEEAKKAVKPGKERAKRVEKGYVAGLQVAHGDAHAAAIRRDDDGNLLAISEEAQATDSHWPAGGGFAQSRRRDRDRATTRTGTIVP